MKPIIIIDSNRKFDGVIMGMGQPRAGKPMLVVLSGDLYNNGGNDLTFQEYQDVRRDSGKEPKLITDKNYDALYAEYLKNKETKGKKITSEHYFEMLEVLPPSRWQNYGMGSGFHVCEHVIGNLVDWFFVVFGEYYSFRASCHLTNKQISEKLTLLIREA